MFFFAVGRNARIGKVGMSFYQSLDIDLEASFMNSLILCRKSKE